MFVTLPWKEKERMIVISPILKSFFVINSTLIICLYMVLDYLERSFMVQEPYKIGRRGIKIYNLKMRNL